MILPALKLLWECKNNAIFPNDWYKKGKAAIAVLKKENPVCCDCVFIFNLQLLIFLKGWDNIKGKAPCLIGDMNWIVGCIPANYPKKARNASVMNFALQTGNIKKRNWY